MENNLLVRLKPLSPFGLSLLIAAGCGSSNDNPTPDSAMPDMGTSGDAGVDSFVEDQGPPVRRLGGTVTGLRGSLFLELNATETLEVTADGTFSFTTDMMDGDTWRVELLGTRDNVGCFPIPNEGVVDVDAATAIQVRCNTDTEEHRPLEISYDATGAARFHTVRTFTATENDITLFRYDSEGAGTDGVFHTSDDVSPYIEVRTVTFGFEEDPTLVVEMDGLGPDGIALTGDDVVTYLGRYVLSPEGHVEGYFEYSGPGDDGLWYTADDAIDVGASHRVENTLDGEGRLVCFVEYDAGPDEQFDTSDDVVTLIEQFVYAADTTTIPTAVRSRERSRYSDAGSDQIPCNSDDTVFQAPRVTWYDADDNPVLTTERTVTRYNFRNYDADGNVVLVENLSTGSNGVVDGPVRTNASSDDVPLIFGGYFYEVSSFTSGGQLSSRYRVADLGTDTVVHTPDDIRDGAFALTYDGLGRTVERFFHPVGIGTLQTGADGIYGTPDDASTRYERREYEGENTRCLIVATGPGANGTFDAQSCANESRLGGTLDDAITNVSYSDFDGTTGRLTRFATSVSSGTDTIWTTVDDDASVGSTVSGTVVYSPLNEAFIRFYIQDRGSDAMTFTSDDVSTVATTFESVDGSLSGSINGPGTDAIWLTGDDDITEYTRVEFNAAGGQRIETVYTAPGPDGMWFTSDDIPDRSTTSFQIPNETWVQTFGTAL